jgi:hypothetical protein
VKGVANAIGVAAKLVANDITRRITEDLGNFAGHRALTSTLSVASVPPK